MPPVPLSARQVVPSALLRRRPLDLQQHRRVVQVALARRQAEVAKEAGEAATKAMTDMAAASPEERVAKQADLTKTAYTSMFDNGREMMDMAAKTADEAVSLVNARFTASIDETKSVLAAK